VGRRGRRDAPSRTFARTDVALPSLIASWVQ